MYKSAIATMGLVLILIWALPTVAQIQTFNVGLGFGVANGIGHTLPGGAVIGTFKTGHVALVTRFTYFSEVKISIGLGSTGPTTTMRDLAVMLGLSTGYINGTSATIEAGLGLATTNRSVREREYYGYTDRKITSSTAGLAIQSQLYARRLGLVLFANLNKEQSFGGAVLCLRIGRCN